MLRLAADTGDEGPTLISLGGRRGVTIRLRGGSLQFPSQFALLFALLADRAQIFIQSGQAHGNLIWRATAGFGL